MCQVLARYFSIHWGFLCAPGPEGIRSAQPHPNFEDHKNTLDHPRVVEAHHPRLDPGNRLPRKPERMGFDERASPRLEIREPFPLHLPTGNQPESAMRSRMRISHEFQGQSTKGHAGVDLHDRLHSQSSDRIDVEEGIDPERAYEPLSPQPSLKTDPKPFDPDSQVTAGSMRQAAEDRNRETPRVGFHPIALVLPTAIREQTGEAHQPKP
jgi:hypothetical protein